MEVSSASERWREASIHSIQLAQTIIGKTNYAVEDSRVTDPLPRLRDACIRESNDRIRAYMRATRAVVTKLQRSRVAANDEIKALNRSKEALERALDHKRKDLSVNQQSINLRSLRPQREKEEDYADQLLLAEKKHLLSLKRTLESQLRKVKDQLQHLNKIRARLSAAIQERSRVTDLLCQSMSSANTDPAVLSWSQKKRSNTMCMPELAHGKLNSSHSAVVLPSRSKSFSAPVPLTLRTIDKTRPLGSSRGSQRSEAGQKKPGDDKKSTTADTGSPGALSSEVVDSMSEASEAVEISREIRRQLLTVMDHTQRMQEAAHSSVNEGITRKLAQTVTLSQHLQVNAGETKLAVQRSQRHYNAQEQAHGYILGPVSSADLTTRERLDRPIVRVYQRHPETDLPEAAQLKQASDLYTGSMDTTMRNLALLKLAGKRLNDDIKDKKIASEIDAGIVRLRRRKADHRWALNGTTWPCKPATAPPSVRRSSTD